ncbi:MAG: sensor histidine kinase, partial [Anaerolineales bacterium]
LQAAEVRHRLALWQRHRLQPLGEYGDFDILGHDLRSPLGTIIASLGLLREELAAYPDAPISLISDLARAAHRQNALIENMVDYMRLSSGQYAYERAPVYLDALLDEFLSQSEESVQRKGVAFVVDAPPITRPVVGQADLLRRATLAVLDNSLKFCTRQSQMQVVLRATNNAARLAIRDTGRPILADYAHYLFQPLGQFSARAAGSRSSVALNLPFAASVMALIGGDLSAEMQDEWAVFTFEMPWHAAG